MSSNFTKQAWSVRIYYIVRKIPFSCGIKREITTRQDRFMLAKLGSQSERRIRFILPASHKITMLHKTEWSRETRT